MEFAVLMSACWGCFQAHAPLRGVRLAPEQFGCCVYWLHTASMSSRRYHQTKVAKYHESPAHEQASWFTAITTWFMMMEKNGGRAPHGAATEIARETGIKRTTFTDFIKQQTSIEGAEEAYRTRHGAGATPMFTPGEERALYDAVLASWVAKGDRKRRVGFTDSITAFHRAFTGRSGTPPTATRMSSRTPSERQPCSRPTWKARSPGCTTSMML